MPIHLPPTAPLTRRRFLQGSLVTGAAMTLKPFSAPSGHAAEENSGKPDRWALLADTHIEADPAARARGACMAENLARVVRQILAVDEPVDAVVINGDCSNIDGQRGDYDVLAKLVQPLREAGLPVHLTLGNHDNRESFFEAFADHRAEAPPVDGKHVSIVEGRQADWVMLDTLRFVNKTEGELGREQLEWLGRHLAGSGEKPVILIGHHYPELSRENVIPVDPAPPIPGLLDGGPLLELAHRHPRVKAYIFGHSHFWAVKTDDHGLNHINLPPTAFVFRPENPSGWVLATAHPDHLTLELRSLDPEHAEHGRVTTLRWI